MGPGHVIARVRHSNLPIGFLARPLSMFFGSMLFVYGGPAAGKTYCKAMTGGMDIDMMRGFVSSGQKCH